MTRFMSAGIIVKLHDAANRLAETAGNQMSRQINGLEDIRRAGGK